MSIVLPERRGRWTVDDLRPLPEDDLNRWEIDDGVLVITPRGFSSSHQCAMLAATNLLWEAIDTTRTDLAAVPAVEVITGRRNDWLKVPDVVVVTRKALESEPQAYEVRDVVLAVEINDTRQSRVRDFGEKVDAYAEEAIQDYWVLELTPEPKAHGVRVDGRGVRADRRVVESDPPHSAVPG